MSTLKANTVTPVTGNTDLTLIGSGTGDVIIDGLTYPTADGSTGEFMKTNGSGVLSFAEAGGGGGLIFISSVTASNAASVAFTSGIDTTYD